MILWMPIATVWKKPLKPKALSFPPTTSPRTIGSSSLLRSSAELKENRPKTATFVPKGFWGSIPSLFRLKGFCPCAILRSDRNGLLLSMEGSTGLLGDPAILEKFYNAGLRVMGLCWTHNELAKSSRLLEGEKDTGLSAQGRKMVEAGNRLGMLFDVSHLSDRSFWDLSALSKKPILATHSDFRGLCSCNRNLTDEMAQEIVRQDGMIGLNLCPKFLSDREERQTLFGFFDHLEYGLSRFGEDHLGFGLDIDGIDRYPEPLTPDSSLHDRIAEFLLKHYPQRVVEKISGSNFISFLKKYL